MKNLKKVLFGLLILVAIALIIVLGCMAYVDIQSSEAKDYLVETYDFNKSDLHITKYTEYVYEDITDCSSLWFKKCTDDENLLYKYTFKTTDGEIIEVIEDKDGNLTDDYEAPTPTPNIMEKIDDSVYEISDEELIDAIQE
ncbi:MAG: hypothetical protein ACI4XM_03190 [Candidatus Coprovivens sp.]